MTEFGCTGRFTAKRCSCVGQQKVVEAKNGITEQIESDNLQYLLALPTAAIHITSHTGLSSSSGHTCKATHTMFAGIRMCECFVCALYCIRKIYGSIGMMSKYNF